MLAGLACLLLVYLALYNLTPETVFFANDQATDFIIAKYAEQGTPPLLGPPSHTGGRHLGPIYYAYVWCIAKLSSFDLFEASLLFALTKIFALGLMLYFLLQMPSNAPPYLVCVSALFIIVAVPNITFLRTQWHSNFLPLTSGLAFCSALGLTLYGSRTIPLIMIGLSALLQTHLSAGPVVLGLGIVVFAYCFLSFSKENWFSLLKSRQFSMALTLIFLMWLPTIYFELTQPSNVAKLLSVHGRGTSAKAGFQSALSTAAEFFYSHTLGKTKAFEFGYAGYMLAALWVFSLIHLILYGNRNERWSLAILCLPVMVTILFLSRFKPPLYQHYYNSSIIVPLLLFVLAQVYAYKVVFKGKAPVAFCRYALLLFIILPALFLPFRVAATLDWYSKPRMNKIHTLAHARQIVDFIERHSADTPALIYPRMAAKLSSNAYVYLSGTNTKEMEYRGFFPEIPLFDHFVAPKKYKKSFMLVCPRAFRVTERGLLRGLSKKWALEEEVNIPAEFLISDCTLYKLRKKRT